MVKITKKTDYGLTLLAALANKPEEMQSLRGISNQFKLPYKFIGQVAACLLDAGIITSKEGASGGYKLAKAPEKISLQEVVNVLDGPVVKVDCLNGKNCPRQCDCQHQHIMHGLAETISDSLKQKTIADLIRSK